MAKGVGSVYGLLSIVYGFWRTLQYYCKLQTAEVCNQRPKTKDHKLVENSCQHLNCSSDASFSNGIALRFEIIV
jgi:hypothetical protein